MENCFWFLNPLLLINTPCTIPFIMKVKLSNQPKKGDTYYGVRLYTNGKYLGSHNDTKNVKKMQYFVKSFLDCFVNELREICEKNGVELEIVEKVF